MLLTRLHGNQLQPRCTPPPDPRRARLAELRQRLEELGRMVSAATGNPWGLSNRWPPAAFTRRGKSGKLLAQAGTWVRKKGRGVSEQAEFYERITGRIIEQMETASVAGWQKPWITTGQNTLQPVNAATRRANFKQ